MAVKVTSRSGKTVTLLDPAEKGAKYAAELRAGIKCTNDHKIKRTKSGVAIGLDRVERAYRAGYLDARKDSANAWKAGQAKRARGRNR
mgnify:FL=1